MALSSQSCCVPSPCELVNEVLPYITGDLSTDVIIFFSIRYRMYMKLYEMGSSAIKRPCCKYLMHLLVWFAMIQQVEAHNVYITSPCEWHNTHLIPISCAIPACSLIDRMLFQWARCKPPGVWDISRIPRQYAYEIHLESDANHM